MSGAGSGAAINPARQRLAMTIALAMALAEVLLVAWVSVRQAPAAAPVVAGLLWIGLKCLPLLLVVPGLVQRRKRAAVWLCFLLCFYFLGAVLTALAPPPVRWLGLLEVLVISTGFTAGLLAARWTPATAKPS